MHRTRCLPPAFVVEFLDSNDLTCTAWPLTSRNLSDISLVAVSAESTSIDHKLLCAAQGFKSDSVYLSAFKGKLDGSSQVDVAFENYQVVFSAWRFGYTSGMFVNNAPIRSRFGARLGRQL